MKFLDVFNEIKKGDYALTDEAVYHSLQNGDKLIPLYGGNKSHGRTDRKISVTAKTKKGIPITVFSGEGIIISLDGSAGSMTYKCNEQFSLNHHAGFITLRNNAADKVCLEFFALYMQNFYKNLSVSDGSKTLSLEQIYSEEFDLPNFSTQKSILTKLTRTKNLLDILQKMEESYLSLLEKEIICDYKNYQAKDIPLSSCIDYLSGNPGLTEEFMYQMQQGESERYAVLSSATEERTMMGTIPLCNINNKLLKIFEGKEGLLVTRNGKAGQTRFLPSGRYTINDHAYILFVKETSPFLIDLRWLALQYRPRFLQYSSSADNGTWNMTGFFKHTKIDIPFISEQQAVINRYLPIESRIEEIREVIKTYEILLTKKVSFPKQSNCSQLGIFN